MCTYCFLPTSPKGNLQQYVHLLLFAYFTEGKFAVTAFFHPQYLRIGKELEVVNYTEDRADTAYYDGTINSILINLSVTAVYLPRAVNIRGLNIREGLNKYLSEKA